MNAGFGEVGEVGEATREREGEREEAEALCCVNVTLPGNGLRTLRPTLVAGKERVGTDRGGHTLWR